MGDLVPVHEKLHRFFGDIDFDFPNNKELKRVSVQWLHSKYLLHEGYLRKKSPRRQNKWQRRYTMLYGHYVFYFKGVKSKMPRGWFSLRPYDKVFEEFGDDPENKKFYIKLKNSRNNEIRVFCFEAATMGDLKMWKASFQAIIDYIHNSGLINNSCQEHILKIKANPPDQAPDIVRKPEYSIMLDTRVSEPELSRLARSLGHGWKSFAREKLRIPQNELDIIREKNNRREDEVYSVLLQWRRRERDNATKRKLIELLKDFCDEIDYCEWEFLENSSTHDYLNDDTDNEEDSFDGDMSDRDVYDDVEVSSQCSSNDLSNPTTQDQEFEYGSNEDNVPANTQYYLPPRVTPSHQYNRNQDQQTGLPTLAAKPVPPSRSRFHSEPHHTMDQTPGPVLPSNSYLPPGRPRMHSDSQHTTGQVARPALPPRPRPPVVSTAKTHDNLHQTPLERWPPTLPRRSWMSESEQPLPAHFNQNENTLERPPTLPRRSWVSESAQPLRIQFNQNDNTNQRTTLPSIPPHNTHGNSNQHNVQGRSLPPRRPPAAAGTEPQRNPVFQRQKINPDFAAELNQLFRS